MLPIKFYELVICFFLCFCFVLLRLSSLYQDVQFESYAKSLILVFDVELADADDPVLLS